MNPQIHTLGFELKKYWTFNFIKIYLFVIDPYLRPQPYAPKWKILDEPKYLVYEIVWYWVHCILKSI